MKFNMILDIAAKTFAEVRLGGKKNDPKLAELDRGVLTVGLLVAALDGAVLPEEYAVFRTLAKKCRGGSAKNVRMLLDAALPAVGKLMVMAQVDVYSKEDRLVAFLAAAAKVLPRGFLDGSMADLRRAFALWVTIGVADGEFSAIEKEAVHALLVRLAIVRTKKTKRGAEKACQLLETDFLAKAEKIARDLASPAKRAKAEIALDELIVTMPSADDKGEKLPAPANGIAVKLATVAVVGLAAAGSSNVARAGANCCGEARYRPVAEGGVVHFVEEPRLVSSLSSKSERAYANCCWCGCKIKYTRTFKWDPYERKWIETTEYVPELCKKCQHKADRANRR